MTSDEAAQITAHLDRIEVMVRETNDDAITAQRPPSTGSVVP
jgi:hypothetical protein